jgi:mono/diheme cytochrome c family protein
MMEQYRSRSRTFLVVGGVAMVATALVLGTGGGRASFGRGGPQVAQMSGMQHPSTGSGQQAEQGAMHPQTAATPAPAQGAGGHGGQGQAAEWKPTWPVGDTGRGREVFAQLECYSCHEVRGETFPAPEQPGKVGPELSQMGPLHSFEYFAEAIINPSGTIEKGQGFESPDGSSKMPSYNDVLTVQQLVDLVSYLRSLKPPAAGATAPPAHEGAGHGR